MATIKITAKRQATLPVKLCNELGLQPGDQINLEHRIIDGVSCWVLKRPEHQVKWMGSLRKYAKGKSHDMKDIRKSIERGRTK